jgi:hypothetical protein
MKSIAVGIAKSGILPGFDSNVSTPETLANCGESTPKDLWADIFRPIPDHHVVLNGGEDVGFYDAEDGGVYRCLQCMHEIWEGTCTFCGRVYPGHDDHDDEEPLHDPQEPHGGFYDLDSLLDAVRTPVRRIFGSVYREEANEEEEYEASFIDDDDDRGWPVVPTRPSSEEPESRLEPDHNFRRYEGSFIDDDDDRGWPIVPTRQSSEEPESLLESNHNFRRSSPISEVSTEEDEGSISGHTLHNPPRRRQIGVSLTPERSRPRNVLRRSSSEDMDSVASRLEPDQNVRRSGRIAELRHLSRRREPYDPPDYDSDEHYLRMALASYPRDRVDEADEDEQSTDEAEPNGVDGIGSDDDDDDDESIRGFHRHARVRSRRRAHDSDDDSE